MKSKVIFAIFCLALILSLSQFALAESSSRYLIKSNNASLKSVFGVMHEFNAGFTADLTSEQVKKLNAAGIKTEKMHLYTFDVINFQEADSNYSSTSSSVRRRCSPQEQIPWGVKKINGGSGGKGVKVAVLDTGINRNHLDLKSNVKLCVDTTRLRIYNSCSDSVGHGTHVAGTIAANGGQDKKGIYGVAPQASLFIIKVGGAMGVWEDDSARGMIYAADKGANIISMSYGSYEGDSVEKEAIDYAIKKGVLIIAASGNDGPDKDTIAYPAAYKEVVSVAAIDSNEEVADFSSRGINDGDYIKETREIEFSAPGVDILSTTKNGCYGYGSGTSMATPHISGLAAKLWQGSASSTRAYLDKLAKLHDIGISGDDKESGFGLPVAP
jgi:subtilisin